MDQIFTCILLLLSLPGTFSKYVYVQEKKYWRDAQSYCRQYYTDLAPVSNERDILELGKLGNVNDYIWIGLEKNSTDTATKWMWSGGGEVSRFFWGQGQPDNTPDQINGLIYNNTWRDFPSSVFSFFCYTAVVVREEKTWEEALEYCREHHDDLASVASETEMLLIQRELNKQDTTDYVWIGLHFFSGDWLWVDRQELDYEAWGQEGKPMCPNVKTGCVGLQVMRGSQSNPNFVLNNLINSVTGQGNTVASEKCVWGASDCEERLHFVCY